MGCFKLTYGKETGVLKVVHNAFKINVKSGSDADRYGYQGEYAECDPETATTSGSEAIGGWNSFDLRMYDANVGRWLSTDPKGIGWSPFIGMGNNPVSNSDPDGGSPQDNITIYSDGSQTIQKTADNFNRYSYYDLSSDKEYFLIQLDKNKNGYMQLPQSYYTGFDDDKVFMFSTYGPEEKRYISEEAAGSLFGVIFDSQTTDMSIGNWSKEDGTTPFPHTSHKLGKNGDIRYLLSDYSGSAGNVNSSLFDYDRNEALVPYFNKYGWKGVLSKTSDAGLLLNGTINDDGHGDHFHLQGYSPSVIRF